MLLSAKHLYDFVRIVTLTPLQLLYSSIFISKAFSRQLFCVSGPQLSTGALFFNGVLELSHAVF